MDTYRPGGYHVRPRKDDISLNKNGGHRDGEKHTQKTFMLNPYNLRMD